MATMYVAWYTYATKVVGGTTMQTEGPFIESAPAVDISAGGVSANAPVGAEYADVWSDVPFYYLPGINPSAAKDKTSKPYPANAVVQIPAVHGTETKIAGIAI
jgi:hypothetical protein